LRTHGIPPRVFFSPSSCALFNFSSTTFLVAPAATAKSMCRISSRHPQFFDNPPPHRCPSSLSCHRLSRESDSISLFNTTFFSFSKFGDFCLPVISFLSFFVRRDFRYPFRSFVFFLLNPSLQVSPGSDDPLAIEGGSCTPFVPCVRSQTVRLAPISRYMFLPWPAFFLTRVNHLHVLTRATISPFPVGEFPWISSKSSFFLPISGPLEERALSP